MAPETEAESGAQAPVIRHEITSKKIPEVAADLNVLGDRALDTAAKIDDELGR